MKKRKDRRTEGTPDEPATSTVSGAAVEGEGEADAGDLNGPSDEGAIRADEVQAADLGAQPVAAEDEVTNRMDLVAGGLASDDAELETTVQELVDAADPLLFGGDLDAAVSVEGAADVETSAAAATEVSQAVEEAGDEGAEALPEVEGSRLESIIESLLFAADRPLTVTELKRLVGERDGKRVNEALETLRARHVDSGIQLVGVAGGWQLRTHPGNGAWVAKLVAGRPTRLSRAMMETLAIVAYRQPITRPEIDEIRGVDCGPVLRTILDRGLIRVIGKKEEVGRPILYGTTPEFLKIFSLRDLADLPTLREFHELGADDRAKVDATTGVAGVASLDGLAGVGGDAPGPGQGGAGAELRAGELSEVDPEEEDSLIEALEAATHAAGLAERALTEPESAEAAAAAEGEPDGAATSKGSHDTATGAGVRDR